MKRLQLGFWTLTSHTLFLCAIGCQAVYQNEVGKTVRSIAHNAQELSVLKQRLIAAKAGQATIEMAVQEFLAHTWPMTQRRLEHAGLWALSGAIAFVLALGAWYWAWRANEKPKSAVNILLTAVYVLVLQLLLMV